MMQKCTGVARSRMYKCISVAVSGADPASGGGSLSGGQGTLANLLADFNSMRTDVLVAKTDPG
jgi:hypothetical protein